MWNSMNPDHKRNNCMASNMVCCSLKTPISTDTAAWIILSARWRKFQVTPSWKEPSVSEEQRCFQEGSQCSGRGANNTPAGSAVTCHQAPVTSCTGAQVRLKEQMDREQHFRGDVSHGRQHPATSQQHGLATGRKVLFNPSSLRRLKVMCWVISKQEY